MSSYTPKHGSNGCTGYVLAFLAVIASIAAAIFIAACAGAQAPSSLLSGAAIGAATYTQSGSDCLTTPGSHPGLGGFIAGFASGATGAPATASTSGQVCLFAKPQAGPKAADVGAIGDGLHGVTR